MKGWNPFHRPVRSKSREWWKADRRRGKKLALTLYTFYLAVILIAAAGHLMAAVTIDEAEQEYRYDLRFRDDGRTGHYTVERDDSRLPATIDVLYEKEENALTLSVRNLRSITVHTGDLFLDEGETIMGVDPVENEEYYREYFVQRNLFTISLETPEGLDMVVIEDIGWPDTAYVNGVPQEEDNVTVSYEGGDVVILDVPLGLTEVELYYDDDAGLWPTDDEGSGDGAFSGQAKSALLVVAVIIAVLCVVWWLLVVRGRRSRDADAGDRPALDEWEEWDDTGGWKKAGEKTGGRPGGKARSETVFTGGSNGLKGAGMAHGKGLGRGGRKVGKSTRKGGKAKGRGKSAPKGGPRKDDINIQWDEGDGGDAKVSWDDEGGAEPTVRWDD
jgi:hypothetical protein